MVLIVRLAQRQFINTIVKTMSGFIKATFNICTLSDCIYLLLLIFSVSSEHISTWICFMFVEIRHYFDKAEYSEYHLFRSEQKRTSGCYWWLNFQVLQFSVNGGKGSSTHEWTKSQK